MGFSSFLYRAFCYLMLLFVITIQSVAQVDSSMKIKFNDKLNFVKQKVSVPIDTLNSGINKNYNKVTDQLNKADSNSRISSIVHKTRNKTIIEKLIIYAYHQLVKDSSKLQQDSSALIVNIKALLPSFRLGSLKSKSLIKDSNNKSNKLPIKKSGYINVQYSCGYIPYVSNDNSQNGFFSSEGNSTIRLLGLPINLSYYYNQLGNINGQNNYFRASFDCNQYEEDLKNKLSNQVDKSIEQLSQLTDEKQLLTQKLMALKIQTSDFSVDQSMFGNNIDLNSLGSGVDTLKNGSTDINLDKVLSNDAVSSTKNLINNIHGSDTTQNLIKDCKANTGDSLKVLNGAENLVHKVFNLDTAQNLMKGSKANGLDSLKVLNGTKKFLNKIHQADSTDNNTMGRSSIAIDSLKDLDGREKLINKVRHSDRVENNKKSHSENAADSLKNISDIEHSKGKIQGNINDKKEQLSQKVEALKTQTLDISVDSNAKINGLVNGVDSLNNDSTDFNQEKVLSNETLNSTKNIINKIQKPNAAENLVKDWSSTAVDSLKTLCGLDHSIENIQGKIKKYEQKISQITEKITLLENSIKKLKNGELPIHLKGKAFSTIESIFEYVKRLDIGYFYPCNSTFLINGVGINGINFETEYQQLHIDITYGVTKNQTYYTNDNQFFLKKFCDFFDYNNQEDGRRLTSVKLGYGKKDASHIYAGLLYGYGANTYLNANDGVEISSPQKEKNYVLEIDAKWNINKSNSIELFFGKSVVSDDESLINNKNWTSGLFDFKYRSNALKLKYSTYFAKTKTKISLSTRWIDPFFKSYGIGYLKSDVFYYDVKVDQPLTKKIKVSVFYRSNEDNILHLLPAKATYKSVGGTISYRLNRFLSLKGTLNPIFQKATSTEMDRTIKYTSYLYNVNLLYNSSGKKVKNTASILLNYFKFFDGIYTNAYYSSMISHAISSKKCMNEISGEWRKISTDSISVNNIIIKNDFSFLFKKKTSVLLGIKWGIKYGSHGHYGYRFKVTTPLFGKVALEIIGDRIIEDEYFYSNNMNTDFLFSCSAKIIYNF
jgi:hypothetical protein